MHPRGEKVSRDRAEDLPSRCLYRIWNLYSGILRCMAAGTWHRADTISRHHRQSRPLEQQAEASISAKRARTPKRRYLFLESGPGRTSVCMSLRYTYSQVDVHVTSSLSTTHSSSILSSYHEAFLAKLCPLVHNVLYRTCRSGRLNRQLPRCGRCTNGLSAEPQHGKNEVFSLSFPASLTSQDPAVVDSAQFGQLWKVSFNAKEQFYAKPLVFTPAATGVQILFLASSQNYIRTLNAKTGAIINTRQVHTRFLQSDIGCTDIPNTIGIIGTPIIDPATEIAYFFSKTYIPNYRVAGNTGVPNGVYYFHGVSLDTLQDVPGYPILIDGSVADNDAQDHFVGGVILQRPSLVQVGNYVYGGFGGHCDLFNYTGLVVGIDIVNKNIASQWAVSVGPLTPHSDSLLQNGAGGQGGIRQSGVGLSTDGSRLFFATGNGNADQNNGESISLI